MSNSLPQFSDNAILESKDAQFYVEQTVSQICKDLNLELIKLNNETGEAAYTNLKLQLARIVEILLDKNPTALFQKFYILDLNQEKVFSILNNSDLASNRMELLAELIIERAFKKVYLRQYFSKNK